MNRILASFFTILLLAMLAGVSFADDLTLRGLNLEKGKTYAFTVEVAADGSVTVTPTIVKTVGPAPSPTPVPTPTPPPPTDLTPRAKAIQAEAAKVGDPTTAKNLAETYRMVASLGAKDGPVKDPVVLQGMAKYAADTLLGPVKAPAWQKTRDELARQWNQVPPAGGIAAYCTLLEEAATGLDAVDLLKGISPEMKKWIWEVLVPLLMKLFLGM